LIDLGQVVRCAVAFGLGFGAVVWIAAGALADLSGPRTRLLAELNSVRVAADLVATGSRIDDRPFDPCRLVEDESLGEDFAMIARLCQEALVRRVPHQTRELVAVENRVIANRHAVRNRQAVAVEVAAEEENAVVAGSAVEALAEGRDEGVVDLDAGKCGCRHSSRP